ncbi:hypothetical protein [Armatimonas sp.]|uniref:hypothetical protein n=1 Tax=Armatimonas sp. TaxID=1872638 RepID=UPI00286B0611|nr:hypothetical protein [Armatimonas sp.]
MTDKIVQLVSGQLSPAEERELRKQATTDPALARELQQASLLWAALPQTARAETSVALWDRIFEATITKNPQPPRPEPSYTSRPLVPFWIPAGSIAFLGICITLFQPLVYQASGRVEVSSKDKTLSLSDVSLLLVLNNTVEHFKTKLVRKRAAEPMTNGQSLCSYTVSRVEATTILEITAEGDNPSAVAETVNFVMAEGIELLESPLKGKIIEKADVPSAPIRPQKGPNIAFAILLGCVVGGLLQLIRRS